MSLHDATTTTTTLLETVAAVPTTGAPSSATAHHQNSQHELLPEFLNQLRLRPTNQPTIKLPANDYPNPFQLSTTASYSTAQQVAASSAEAKTLRDRLFGPRCSNCSSSSSSSSSNADSSSRHRHSKSAEHSILHPKQFKHRATIAADSSADSSSFIGISNNHDRRRTVLRQPQLRLLEQCLLHGLTRSCASLPASATSQSSSGASTPTPAASSTPNESKMSGAGAHGMSMTSAAPAAVAGPSRPGCRSSVQERLQRGYRRWHLHDSATFADVRSLLAGCERLSLSASTESTYTLTAVTPEQQNSRAFRQLQRHHNHLNHHHNHHHHPGAQTPRLKSSAHPHSRSSVKMQRSRSEDRLSSVSSAASTSAQAASTCSQQARQQTTTGGGGTGAADCDVTIDELASYFETFVHIPKKMSSMAEMMYI